MNYKNFFVIFIGFSISLVLGGRVRRVVDGEDVPIVEYPYAVSLRENEQHICGGSIVHHQWVLTAAHCVHEKQLLDLSILFGTKHLHDFESPENHVAYAKRIVMHPNFNEDILVNDIALIEVEERFTFSPHFHPIDLADPDEKPSYDEDAAVLVGWGRTDTDGFDSEILQQTNLTIFSDDECLDAVEFYSPVSNICAGDASGSKGECRGDSGGPLTVGNVQFGIASFLPQTECGELPGAFSNVAFFRRWIRSYIGI